MLLQGHEDKAKHLALEEKLIAKALYYDNEKAREEQMSDSSFYILDLPELR